MNRTTLSVAIQRALVAPVGVCVLMCGPLVAAQQISPHGLSPANSQTQVFQGHAISGVATQQPAGNSQSVSGYAQAPVGYQYNAGVNPSAVVQAQSAPGVPGQARYMVYQTPQGQVVYQPIQQPVTQYRQVVYQTPQGPVIYQVPVSQQVVNSHAAQTVRPVSVGQSAGQAQAQPYVAPSQLVYAQPGQIYQQPLMVYPQVPQQQYTYVESSQPGLYRRVPVQPAQQPQQHAVVSRANSTSVSVSGPGLVLPQRVPSLASGKTDAALSVSIEPDATTNSDNAARADIAYKAALQAAKIKKAKTNLPILTNPLLTKRAAEQARDIAIAQQEKKQARRKAARTSAALVQTAGNAYQQAGATAQVLGAATINQAAHTASQLPATTGKVARYAPSNVAPVAPNPFQQAPTQWITPQSTNASKPYYPAVQNGAQGRVLVQQSNGQWVARQLNPYRNAMLQPQMPVAIQQPPVTVIQNGVPVQYPGQVVYQYPGQGQAAAGVVQNQPATGIFQGVPQVPRPPLTQLIPPRPAAGAITSAVAPVTTATQVVTNAIVSNLVSSPKQRTVERKQTGSLSRSDSEPSLQPGTSLGHREFNKASAVNVEAALNALPQVTASDGATSNLSQGLANLDIRGLGPKRTAVLLNGRPFVPANGNGVVNLDAIPLPLIERIDLVTGGNSAIYGSGAMAGVANFVVNDRFQGAQFDVNHETAFDGEGASTSAALTYGTAFADQRGHFALSLGATERKGARQSERAFSEFAQFEDVDSLGNPVLVDGGSSGVPGTSIFAGGLGQFSPSFGGTFDAEGVLRPFNDSPAGAPASDFYNFAGPSYLVLPQSRQQVLATTRFAMTDNHELYATGLVSNIDTATELAPLPVFTNAEFTLDGSPFIAASSQGLLSDAFGAGVDSDGDGIDDTANAFLRRRMVELGGRRAEFKSTTGFAEGGLRGAFGQLEYDLYLSKGRVSEAVSRTGGLSRDRYLQGLLLDLDASLDGQSCQNTGTSTCVPANIFGPGNISPQAADFLSVDINEKTTSSQSTYGANLTGNFNVLPGGAARVTLGAERRDTTFDRELNSSDPLSSGDLILQNVNTAVSGDTSVDSVFAEVYLPLLADLPFVKTLDASAAYRLSDHSSAGQFASYKAGASWSPMDFVTVRASYDNSNRAPSVAELFTPQMETLSSTFDPCSGAAGPISSEVAAQCISLGVPPELVGSAFLDLPAGQLTTLTGGNPNLNEESAETYSAGMSFNFPLGENTALEFGADYFTVDGDSAIEGLSLNGASVLQSCFDPSYSSNGQANPFCGLVNRREDGSIEAVELFNQNGAGFSVEGYDFAAGLSSKLANGMVMLNYRGSQLDSARFTGYEGAQTRECAGRFGLNCLEPRPTYKHSLAATYQDEKMSADLVWRHIGGVNDDDDETVYATEGISGRNYIDLQLNLQLSDRTDVAFGVQNIGNTQPPVVGANQRNANTYPQTYDALGRTFFLRFSGTSGLGEK